MRMKLYFIYCTLSILFVSQSSFAQKRFFTELTDNDKVALRKSGSVETLKKFSAYTLNISELYSYLKAAPAENKSIKRLPLDIPLPNGIVEVFDIAESSVLSPELAIQHPEIKTYTGKGRQNPGYKIRFSITTEGFSAIILGVDGDAVLFEKVKNTGQENIYRSYFSRDAIVPQNFQRNFPDKGRCTPLSNPHKGSGRISEKKSAPFLSAKFSNGSSLKDYKLAIAATAEFTAAKGGQSSAYSTIVTYVNELNAIYESELSVRLTLVSGTNVIYTNAGTDPYTANNQSTMLNENQVNLDDVIGSSGYDVGHVFGDGGAGSGGGLAVSPSVCDNTSKGKGASDIGDEQSYAHVFTLQLIAHEIGHQFGMSHTYNSNIPVCTTREYATSVEPGSGATIMSYGFTCDSDDYSDEYDGNGKKIGPFLNFHTVSLAQALNHITSTSCYSTVATGNTIPVISTPATTSYTIPKSTPFALTGSATDADGEPVTYSWEGTNISNLQDDEDGEGNPIPPAALTPAILDDETSAPFFRSYIPVATGTRTYPLLSAILNGTNKAKGDKLPSVATTTTHTLTVRDNAGGVATEDIIVNVDNSGPFLISNDPNGTQTGGSTLNISWSVNGTAAAPVNCTLVDILLSADGGITFPTTLASAVSNSGSADVTIPNNINTSQARIKIAPSASTASGNSPNIFFDISNQDFSISSTLPVSLLSFEAQLKDNNDVLLFWQTAQEINNKGFDIEISQDGQLFSKSGFVNGAGNSSTVQQYQYPVTGLANGAYFFRLKQMDSDGKFVYSKVVRVVINVIGQRILIYPNPTDNTVRFDPGKYTGKLFSIQIVDQVGRTVLAMPSQKYTPGFEININGLSKGVYHVILTGTDFKETLKLMKL